ncbi:MAG: hypothetical protein ACD_61C00051G0001 [uncultured bacterium]|nr:MAG: hypothetical protein ACD_61C00051G0001 [uncultured bacterium]
MERGWYLGGDKAQMRVAKYRVVKKTIELAFQKYLAVLKPVGIKSNKTETMRASEE